MRFWHAARRPTSSCRVAISARRCRVAGSGSVTVGDWPTASRSASRFASSLSVFRFRCLNFHASAAVFATFTTRPRATATS